MCWCFPYLIAVLNLALPAAEREMLLLKNRLMETEAQMSRILKAMETVQSKVTDLPPDLLDLKVSGVPDSVLYKR